MDHTDDSGSNRPRPGYGMLTLGPQVGGKARGGSGLLLWPCPSLSPGFTGLWLAPLGNIQVLACNQYLPRGLLSYSPRETGQPGGCAVARLVWEGWDTFPWLLSPPPGPFAAPSAFWGSMWCWIPTNLGLLEVSIPVCSVAFPLFSCFQGLDHFSPFIHVDHYVHSHPSSLANTAAARCKSLGQTSPTPTPHPARLLQLCPHSCVGLMCGQSLSYASTPLVWWAVPAPAPCRVPD